MIARVSIPGDLFLELCTAVYRQSDAVVLVATALTKDANDPSIIAGLMAINEQVRVFHAVLDAAFTEAGGREPEMSVQ
jgi:hypothetical protein